MHRARNTRLSVAAVLIEAVERVCRRWAVDEDNVHKPWIRLSKAGIDDPNFQETVDGRVGWDKLQCSPYSHLSR